MNEIKLVVSQKLLEQAFIPFLIIVISITIIITMTIILINKEIKKLEREKKK